MPAHLHNSNTTTLYKPNLAHTIESLPVFILSRCPYCIISVQLRSHGYLNLMALAARDATNSLCRLIHTPLPFSPKFFTCFCSDTTTSAKYKVRSTERRRSEYVSELFTSQWKIPNVHCTISGSWSSPATWKLRSPYRFVKVDEI